MASSANVLPKMTVVLDMDETLIHSRFLEMSEAETVEMRQAEERQSNVKSVDDSFHVVLTEGGPKTTVAVNRRPQLAAFLESLAARWRVVIFTAATQDYADPVLDVIDPTGAFFAGGRLYRQHCTRLANGGYVKDLTTLPLPSHLGGGGGGTRRGFDALVGSGGAAETNLARTVLVDNSPSVFLPQPFNGIPIESFYDDAEDDALRKTLALLDALDEESDVRRLIASKIHNIQFNEGTGRMRVEEIQKQG